VKEISVQLPIHSLAERALAWLMIAAMFGTGCVLAPVPAPVPGLPEFQGLGVVAVPGGLYNVAGRNLMLQRADVSVDTRILAGTAIGATYNSATASWHWSYEMRFDGDTFVDHQGAVYDVATLADGAAVPGTYWVRVDGDTVKTKGGLVFDFDAQGQLQAEYWSSDPYPRYQYVRDPDFIELRECASEALPIEQCRLVFTIDLGPSGPTRILDEESMNVGITRESLYAYDVLGRMKTARTPFEVDEGLPGTRYEYDSGGLLTARVDSEASRIEYSWIFGWLAQVTQIGEGDPSHAFTHPQIVDGEASLYSVIHANPLGGQTKYTFTAGGHVTQIERIDTGEAMTVVWNQPLNRPSQIIGFDGTTRQLQGWVDDDPTIVIEPSGNVVQLSYEPDGVDAGEPLARPIASVVDSLGAVWAVTYDTAGRPVTKANGEDETTVLDYVGAEVSRATAPWGSTLDFVSYGVHGHWRTGISSSVPEASIQRKFDRMGNLVVPAAGLQEGGVLERAYNASRLLESLEVGATDENGAVISTDFVNMTRRSDGQILTVSRPHGADHVLEYDALGRNSRLRERVDGAWKDTTYEYSAAGDLTAIEQPNGMREEFDHDLYGRTLERRTLRDGVVEAHALFEWADGRPSRWYDSVRGQWETVTYDAAGRARTMTYSGLGESLTFDYDVRSRITKKTFQFGADTRVIEIEWDLADRRTRVFTEDGAGALQELVRSDYQQGRLQAIEYGNGLRRENLFDAGTERFAGYRTTDLVSSVIVEETTITREAKVNPTRLEVTSWTETSIATTQEQYWLGLGGNLLNPDRKIGARVFWWKGWTWIDDILQHQDEQVYAWDERNNMVDDSDGDTLTYNMERNRLLTATVNGVSHTYSYDDAGYVTSRDGMPINWTAAGRLATVGPVGNPLVEIESDLAGRPVSVTAFGATREFALFGGRVEYDAGTGQTGWLQLPHVSLPFVGDKRIYRHVDALGNVSFTTDELGTVTSHRRYHPFGLDRVYGGSSFSENDHRGFVGGVELQHNGVETGLVVLGARILDSDVGRFLSQDPIFDLLNAYTYAYGNPVQYEDTGGRHAVSKPSAAESTSAALDVIGDFFVATGAGLIAVGGIRAVQGKPAEATISTTAGLVLGFFGFGFYLASSIAGLVRIASQSNLMETPPPKPGRSGGGLPQGGKKIELVPDFGFATLPPIAVCAGAPVAASAGTDTRGWHWAMLNLLVLFYMIWCGGTRSKRIAAGEEEASE
jgi:RHS repeat-associated protein